MLKVFRQRKAFLIRALFVAIVGSISLVFVIQMVPGLGVGTGFGANPDVLARVDEREVTRIDVENEYQRRAQTMGDSELFRTLIRERAIEDLIQERTLEYEATRLGIRVPPEEVAQRLRESPTFYPNGKFIGQEAYKNIIQSQFRMSVPQFEQMVARRTQAQRLFTWVTGGLSVSPAEVTLAYRRRSEMAQIEYVLVSADELAGRLRPSEDELRAYFETQKDRYPIPERRGVRTVLVDEETLRARIPVSQAELDAYYRTHRDEYHVPERARVRQILFLKQAPLLAQPRDPAELKQTAEKVLAEAKRGKDFAALAREHSDDQNSRERGGELGWVRRGQASPDVDKVLFEAAPGSFHLVETSYGFHLLTLLERQAEHVQPLEEVRGDIEALLKAQKLRERSLAEAKQISDAARGGRPLEAAARELNWTMEEPPPFGRGELTAPFGGHQEFQDWVFRQPPENAGRAVSDPIGVPGGYVVVQLREVVPAHGAAFEEVRERVEQAWRRERGQALAKETAAKIAAEAKQSGDLKRAAQRVGLEAKPSQPLTRERGMPELGPVSNLAPVFTLPLNTVGEPLAVGDNRVVYKVTARTEFAASQLARFQQEQLREQLLQEKRGLTWMVFMKALEKRLKAEGVLEVNEKLKAELLAQR
ncbi:MAG: peptidyl-prolyl cis-trans isomerase [Candidatus Acidiferrales bacterium]